MSKYLVIELAIKGDKDALGQIYTEYKDDVYFYAMKIVKNKTIAEDVVQDVMVEVFKSICKLEHPEYFKTWLFRICHNVCYRFFSKETKSFENISLDDDDTYISDVPDNSADILPQEVLEEHEIKDTVNKLLDELPETQREVLILFYYKDMSVSEITSVLNCPSGTVKSNLNYARKKVKSKIENYETENGVKLHSIGIGPIIAYVLNNASKKIQLGNYSEIYKNVCKFASVEVSSAVIGTTATATATITAGATASVAAKTGATAIIMKIIAGITAASIVVGGAILINSQSKKDKNIPSEIATTSSVISYPKLETEKPIDPLRVPVVLKVPKLFEEKALHSIGFGQSHGKNGKIGAGGSDCWKDPNNPDVIFVLGYQAWCNPNEKNPFSGLEHEEELRVVDFLSQDIMEKVFHSRPNLSNDFQISPKGEVPIQKSNVNESKSDLFEFDFKYDLKEDDEYYDEYTELKEVYTSGYLTINDDFAIQIWGIDISKNNSNKQYILEYTKRIAETYTYKEIASQETTSQEIASQEPIKYEVLSKLDATIPASDYVKIPCTMEVPKLFKTKPYFEVYNENQETMYYTRMWKDENNPDVIYAISEYLGTDGCPSLKGNNLAYVSELGKTKFVCEKSMDKYFNNKKYPANVYNIQMEKTGIVSTSSTDIYLQQSDLMEFVYTFYELGNLYDTEYIYVTGHLVNHYALPIQVWAIDTSKDHLYKDEILKITSKIAKSVRISYPDNEPK